MSISPHIHRRLSRAREQSAELAAEDMRLSSLLGQAKEELLKLSCE